MNRNSVYVRLAAFFFVGTTLLAGKGWGISDDSSGVKVRLRGTLPGGAYAESFDPIIEPDETGEVVGNGDGRIHVIPTLSAPSIKNGEKLVVSAVVKAQAGVAKIEADLGGIETIALRPAPMGMGGGNATGALGMYSAEWIGHDLEEKVYTVTLRITDNDGHTFVDDSLSFSDPAAGNTDPGSTLYPNGGIRRIGKATMPNEQHLSAAVIDASAGYAYFGTSADPTRVVKVALGSGSNPPTNIGSVTLNAGESGIASAVIDTTAGYAYFITGTFPARVVKVALGVGSDPPTRVGALTLNAGEDWVFGAVVDASAGYAYLPTATNPGRVVKVALGSGANLPTRIGVLTLEAGESAPRTGVIDPSAGYAWFGTGDGRVVKVALGAGSDLPTRVGAVTLELGESNPLCSVIDPSAGYAYFGTLTSPGRVVKVALGAGSDPPTRVGAVTLNTGEDRPRSAVIDASAGYAYFTTETVPGLVVKVALGAGANPPTRVGALTLNTDEDEPRSAVIDASAGYAYIGSWTAPGRVVKVALGVGANLPTRVDTLTLEHEAAFGSAVLDASAGYAYFGTSTSPGRVVKVALGAGANPPTRVGSLTLNAGENQVPSAVIDPSAGYAWFGTGGIPGNVVKVALGSGIDPPTRIGSVAMATGENNLTSAVIDASAVYAYFGTSTSPGRVVKVALGAGSDPPSRIGAATMNAGEGALVSAVIDASAGYAYFGTNDVTASVVKVALGAGANPPARVGGVTLNVGERSAKSAVIDASAGYAYFGTGNNNARVVKVALGEGAAPPTRVGSVELLHVEDEIDSVVMDASARYAYFGTNSLQGRIVKVALGDGDDLPVRVDSLILDGGDSRPLSAVADHSTGYAYFGTFTTPGEVIKVSLYDRDIVVGTRITVPEPAVVNDVRFYSHTADGNLRLAIYDTNSPANLLWESGSFANVTGEDWATVPISSGSPTSLVLSASDYWLAYQADNAQDVPSYISGSLGNGFSLDHAFGPFPTTIQTSGIETSDEWAMHLTYGPEITGGPVTFDDQEIDAGASAAHTVTIENTGDFTLNFTGVEVTLTGADAGEFGIAGDSGENSLPSGASRTVDLVFDPSSPGAKEAFLTIQTNDLIEKVANIPLSGTGIDPEINVLGIPVSFGQWDIEGGPSPVQKVTIQNQGTSPLIFQATGVEITGADFADFVIVNNPTFDSVSPGSIRSIDIVFDPTTVGTKTAQLGIYTNDWDEPTIIAEVSGEGLFFPAVSPSIDLNDPPGAESHPLLRIYGDNPDDALASSHAFGDINGDGYDDFIAGTPFNSPGGRHWAGEVYIFYGDQIASSTTINLNTPIGSNGETRIQGDDGGSPSGDFLGTSLACGDINGDGYDDIVIGALFADDRTGEAYVFFGNPGISSATQVDLSLPPTTNGEMRIYGEVQFDYLGSKVAAGDIDRDGFDDIILGGGAINEPRKTYIIYGHANIGGSIVDLDDAPGTYGETRIFGSGENVLSFGGEVGDMNGDGFLDVILGNTGADRNGLDDCGEVVVLYGDPSWRDSVIDLDVPFGTHGETRIQGRESDGYLGWSSASGDIDGDGFDDLLLGAYGVNAHGITDTGEAYVIYGSPTLPDATLDLAMPPGTHDETRFLGNSIFGDMGSWVGTSDVNGDGKEDILLGAPTASPGGRTVGRTEAGEVYIIYGRDFLRGFSFDVSDASEDVIILGGTSFDDFGYTVSGGGDLNRDGVAEMAAAARDGDNPTMGVGNEAGLTVTVFGQTSYPEAVGREFIGPGDTPMVGVGGRLSPVIRSWVSFDDGDNGVGGASLLEATVSRTQTGLSGLGSLSLVADGYWNLSTDRVNYNAADLTFQYLDEEVTGLEEDNLYLLHSTAPGGPWSAASNNLVDPSRNEISGQVDSLGYFAIRDEGVARTPTPTPTLTPTNTATPTSTPTRTNTPSIPEWVWVDFSHAGAESGTFAEPYNTVQEGVSLVNPGGTIKFKAGSTSETIQIAKAMRLEAPLGGPVRIGTAGAKAEPVSDEDETPDKEPVSRFFGAKELLRRLNEIESKQGTGSSLLEDARHWMRESP